MAIQKRAVWLITLITLLAAAACSAPSTETATQPAPTAAPVVTPSPTPASSAITTANISRLHLASSLGRGRPLQALWAPDGKSIAVLTRAGIWLYDPSDLRAEPRWLPGLDHALSSLTIDPSGKSIAAGAEDGAILEWDTASGHPGPVLTGHTDTVTSLSYDDDGSALASVSRDDTLLIFDAATGEQLGRQPIAQSPNALGNESSVAFSPTGALIAYSDVLDSGDNVIRLWDYKRASDTVALDTTQGLEIGPLAFSPDGALVSAPMGAGDLQLWDVKTGRMSADLAVNVSRGPNGEDMGLSTEPVSVAAFSPDGTHLAAGGAYEGALTLWDIHTQQQTRSFYRLASGSQSNAFLSASFSPDGAQLVTVDSLGEVELWTVSSGENGATLSDFNTALNRLAVSPDGSLLAAGGDDINGSVWEWDRATGTRRFALAAHTRLVSGLAFTPDGKWLASSSWDQTVRLWDTQTGRAGAAYQGFIDDLNANNWLYDLAISPDGAAVAAAGEDGYLGKVWLFNAGSASSPATLEGTPIFQTVALSPDGRLIAAGDLNGAVTVWDVATQQQVAVLNLPADRTSMQAAKRLAFSPDSKYLAEATDGGAVRVWDIDTRAPRFVLAAPAAAVAFSPDDRLLAALGDTLKIFDATSGAQLADLPQPALAADMVFTPDGSTIAVAYDDGVVRLWSVR